MIDLVAGLVGLLYRDLSYYSSYKKRKKEKKLPQKEMLTSDSIKLRLVDDDQNLSYRRKWYQH
jgi:hypothetical protein